MRRITAASLRTGRYTPCPIPVLSIRANHDSQDVNELSGRTSRFGRKPTVTLGNAVVRNTHASLPLKTASRAGLTVLGTAQFTESVEFSTGSFIFGKSTVPSAQGPVDTNFRGAPSLRFEADDGGTLRLPKLTSLAGRTALVSSGFDSLLEAPLLSAVAGTPALRGHDRGRTFRRDAGAGPHGETPCSVAAWRSP